MWGSGSWSSGLRFLKGLDRVLFAIDVSVSELNGWGNQGLRGFRVLGAFGILWLWGGLDPKP